MAQPLLKELDLTAEDLIVLYDELAFPLGTLAHTRNAVRANGHNGVKSISAALGTEEWTSHSSRHRQTAHSKAVAKSKAGGTGVSARAHAQEQN